MTFPCDNPVSAWLEPENKFPSKRAIWPVEEMTEARAVQIVLYVSRIEAIEQVEHAQSHFHLVFLAAKRDSQFLKCLKIDGIEAPESLGIARADKVARLVHSRVGKSGVKVPDRQHSNLQRRYELSPGQKAIWRVEG